MSWWNTEMNVTITGIALVLIVGAIFGLWKKLGPLKRIGKKGIEFGDSIKTTIESLDMTNTESGDLEDHVVKVKDLEKHLDKVLSRFVEQFKLIEDKIDKFEERLTKDLTERRNVMMILIKDITDKVLSNMIKIEKIEGRLNKLESDTKGLMGRDV